MIEAPGKVIFHVRPSPEPSRLRSYHVTTTQTTTICETAFGPINNDNLTVQSFVEEDGELKILRSKEFSDSMQYNSFYSAKAAAEKTATS